MIPNPFMGGMATIRQLVAEKAADAAVIREQKLQLQQLATHATRLNEQVASLKERQPPPPARREAQCLRSQSRPLGRAGRCDAAGHVLFA
jgi:hypothetical protein